MVTREGSVMGSEIWKGVAPRADKAFGATTSRGYAPGVPEFFRRSDGSSDIEKSLDEGVVELNIKPGSKVALSSPQGKLEYALAQMSRIVLEYNPVKSQKPVVRGAEFLRLRKRIDYFLQGINGDDLKNYKSRYDEVVSLAYEKSRDLLRREKSKRKK